MEFLIHAYAITMQTFCDFVTILYFLHVMFVDPTKMANLQRFTDILESLFDQVISEGKTLCTYM